MSTGPARRTAARARSASKVARAFGAPTGRRMRRLAAGLLASAEARVRPGEPEPGADQPLIRLPGPPPSADADARPARSRSVGEREDHRAVLRDGERVLGVGGSAAVAGDDRPAVATQVVRVVATLDEHRLDRDHQARLELEPPARGALVRDVRLLVHRVADAVAAEVLRQPVAGAPPDGAHRGPDVAQPVAGPGRRDARLESRLGQPDQAQAGFVDVADGNGDRRVGVTAHPPRRRSRSTGCRRREAGARQGCRATIASLTLRQMTAGYGVGAQRGR